MSKKKEKKKSGEKKQVELARQADRMSIFYHGALSKHAQRINKMEAIMNGLIEELNRTKAIELKRLEETVNRVRDEIMARKAQLFVGVSIRAKEDLATFVAPEINCEERLHICKAACCKLNYVLSMEEIESGKIKWDLGMPYYIRQDEDGYCVHMDKDKMCCTIYEERPLVCRKYSCKNDGRIWKDFDNMILNEEWTEAKLGPINLSLEGIELVPQMDIQNSVVKE